MAKEDEVRVPFILLFSRAATTTGLARARSREASNFLQQTPVEAKQKTHNHASKKVMTYEKDIQPRAIRNGNAGPGRIRRIIKDLDTIVSNGCERRTAVSSR